MRKFYVCNRKRCKKCDPDCFATENKKFALDKKAPFAVHLPDGSVAQKGCFKLIADFGKADATSEDECHEQPNAGVAQQIKCFTCPYYGKVDTLFCIKSGCGLPPLR